MLEPIPFWGMIEVDLPVKTYAGNKFNNVKECMNKPVAWMNKTEDETVFIENTGNTKVIGGNPIPLYTHPHPDNLGLAESIIKQQQLKIDNLLENNARLDAEIEVLKSHPVKEQKCIVKDCENHKHEGGFVGDLCKPCHQFITTGEGVYSQAYRNTHQAAIEALKAYPVKELTDEEIAIIADKCFGTVQYDLFLQIHDFALAILRKAQEK